MEILWLYVRKPLKRLRWGHGSGQMNSLEMTYVLKECTEK